MAWTPLLLVFLSHCTGSLSQPVLTQSDSLSASLGASARLSCTLSNGYNIGSLSITWYQQKPGSPPRYLLSYNSDSQKLQGSGVPRHFSGSQRHLVQRGAPAHLWAADGDEAVGSPQWLR
uniref:Ig-like domain-containing protein n=1 Tax=Bos indicus x Bos taurus TaxID=30522 RepID=A0A4W2BU87_BOBOX